MSRFMVQPSDTLEFWTSKKNKQDFIPQTEMMLRCYLLPSKMENIEYCFWNMLKQAT